jgi:hypothetical protein
MKGEWIGVQWQQIFSILWRALSREGGGRRGGVAAGNEMNKKFEWQAKLWSDFQSRLLKIRHTATGAGSKSWAAMNSKFPARQNLRRERPGV